MNSSLARIALALVVTGCSSPTIVVGDLQEVTSMKAIPNRDLDILFVVDNSGSMAEQQAALAANFPRMMDVLAELDGGLPNLHLGVVTSDYGTMGSGSPSPAPPIGSPGNGGCANAGDDGALQTNGAAVTGNFISDIDVGGTRQVNYAGDLRDVFARMAQVGVAGCGFEQHLAAMRRGLTNPVNAGFLRAGANLAVVIIGDEDDCSVAQPGVFGPASPQLGSLQSFRCTRFGITCNEDVDVPGAKTDCVPAESSQFIEDVQPFVDALLAVKGDPRRVMVAGIVGDPTPVETRLAPPPGGGAPEPMLVPSCTFDGPQGPETADPAVRLSAFLDAFPGRSQRTSICSADLSSPLAVIGDSAKKLVGDPCIDTSLLADASPSEPGVQPACEVVDLRDSAPDAPSVLPECSASGTDCFELRADPIACPATADHLRVAFRRSATLTDDTWTSVRCQLR